MQKKTKRPQNHKNMELFLGYTAVRDFTVTCTDNICHINVFLLVPTASLCRMMHVKSFKLDA